MTPTFSALLQRFFTERLARQRQASPHTIAAYRDTFRLVLHFAAERLHRAPSAITMEDLSPAFIGEFLEHLSRDRHNSSRTRNARLAAVHAFAHSSPSTSPPMPSFVSGSWRCPTGASSGSSSPS